jgi:uncharacterized protein DUF6959
VSLGATVKIEPVEIYADTSNFAVLRHPGRKFPGALVQGDSLSSLVSEAQFILKRVSKSKDVALVGSVKRLTEQLESRLAHYEQVLAEHNLPLPYKRNDT